jgi:hypothetical protein
MRLAEYPRRQTVGPNEGVWVSFSRRRNEKGRIMSTSILCNLCGHEIRGHDHVDVRVFGVVLLEHGRRHGDFADYHLDCWDGVAGLLHTFTGANKLAAKAAAVLWDHDFWDDQTRVERQHLALNALGGRVGLSARKVATRAGNATRPDNYPYSWRFSTRQLEPTLVELVEAGDLERERVPMTLGSRRFHWVYWRKAAVTALPPELEALDWEPTTDAA